ncbi:MAG: pentapeptide repeat-containing protein [Chloroflexia bacterium]|nr:pentapeptide repeat-containing protein [Chloroflexia bacterium]
MLGWRIARRVFAAVKRSGRGRSRSGDIAASASTAPAVTDPSAAIADSATTVPVATPPTLRRSAAVPPLITRADRLLLLLGIAGLLVTATSAIGLFDRGRPAGDGGGSTMTLIGALVTLAIWVIYVFWKVPQWQAATRASDPNLTPRDLFEIENAARGTLGQILGGVAVLTGLIFAWQQLGNTGETLRVSQEGQITERFTRAVDQLGNDDPAARLGGIYALERIARDSERDHRPAMEVLTAFVRRSSPRVTTVAGVGTPAPAPVPISSETQAILSILGRRETRSDGAGCLNLSRTNLVGANLTGATLTNICFGGADLSDAALAGADLHGVDLGSADLSGANLGGATLIDTRLNRASLSGANLTQADLTGANLVDADLRLAILDRAILRQATLLNANLDSAILFGADLTDASGLTSEQLSRAVQDGDTILPVGLRASPSP